MLALVIASAIVSIRVVESEENKSKRMASLGIFE
jgi:hypothetical protein